MLTEELKVRFIKDGSHIWIGAKKSSSVSPITQNGSYPNIPFVSPLWKEGVANLFHLEPEICVYTVKKDDILLRYCFMFEGKVGLVCHALLNLIQIFKLEIMETLPKFQVNLSLLFMLLTCVIIWIKLRMNRLFNLAIVQYSFIIWNQIIKFSSGIIRYWLNKFKSHPS